MHALKNIFITASAIFAVVPGVGALSKSIGVPPINNYDLLFGATLEVLGISSLFIIWLNRNRISQISSRYLSIISIILMATFLFALILYIFIYESVVIPVPNDQPLYFPLWSEGQLHIDLDKVQGDKIKFISIAGRDYVQKIISRSPPIYLQLTTVLLLLNYLVVFLPATICFSLLAIRYQVNATA